MVHLAHPYSTQTSSLCLVHRYSWAQALAQEEEVEQKPSVMYTDEVHGFVFSYQIPLLWIGSLMFPMPLMLKAGWPACINARTERNYPNLVRNLLEPWPLPPTILAGFPPSTIMNLLASGPQQQCPLTRDSKLKPTQTQSFLLQSLSCNLPQ